MKTLQLRNSANRYFILYAIGILIAGWFLAHYVICYFDGPMLMPHDPGQHLFTSFYFSENTSFFPVPRIETETDWSIFPYGFDHTFLHWSFERDYFYTFFSSIFGIGPWFQTYFLLSTLLTAVASFLLLRPEHGPLRAAIVGFAVSFGNVYSIRKFPLHIPHSCVHWCVLGILVDYLLVRTWIKHRRLPVWLIIVRSALLILCLGLDLGYMAGYSITSFVLAASWIAVTAVYRGVKSTTPVTDSIENYLSNQLQWASSHRTVVSILLVTLLIATWLYLPLAFQISRSAKTYDFTGLHVYKQWESPLRLLVPYLPGFNPTTTGNLFSDKGENWGFHFSPGLSFVLLAALGLATARRKLLIVVPFLVLFVLFVTFHPVKFPSLNFLPWFTFSRIPGRATAMFPIILAIFALQIPRFETLKTALKIAVIMLFGLSSVEFVTAQSIIISENFCNRRQATFIPDDSFFELMREIRATPGQAILEWPFAITPRNPSMSIYFNRVGSSFQMAIFHGKKTIGTHVGRTVTDRLRPVISAGWPRLFLREDKKERYPERQSRDFNKPEWEFFEKFYQLNDFCGILLYPDMLPEETVQGMIDRFGPPVAESSFIGGPGKMLFFPKSEEARLLQDPEKGRSLRLPRERTDDSVRETD